MASAASTTAETDEDRLADICKKTVEWENAGDRDAASSFDELLDMDLCFRRAGGETVGKKKFIRDLPASSKVFKKRELYGDVDCRVYGPVAVASLCVMTTPRDDATGEAARVHYFRNIRIFRREGERWVLEMWLNAETPKPDIGNLIPDSRPDPIDAPESL